MILSLENLKYSYRDESDKIDICNNSGNVNFGINIAIPCGLIVNELLTNSIKYAFRGRKSGEIRIDIDSVNKGRAAQAGLEIQNGKKSKNVYYMVKVSDNGVGLPDDFDLNDSGTLGMQIVQDLVDQLNGVVNVSTEGGTTFEIIFPGN